MYLISKFDYSFIIVILFIWKKRLKRQNKLKKPLQYVQRNSILGFQDSLIKPPKPPGLGLSLRLGAWDTVIYTKQGINNLRSLS